MKTNNTHTICMHDASLADAIFGRSLVVHCTNVSFVRTIANTVRQHNTLHALWVHTSLPLSTIELLDSWKGIPVMLECPCMGDFKKVRERLAKLRSSDITVFFPSTTDENYTSINILSSLGVHCGITFADGPIPWERLNDLLHYAVYSKAKHAPVEPFDTLLNRYRPFTMADLDAVYHNSPAGYFHMSPEGNIALTAEDTAASNFCAQSLDNLLTIEDSPAYQSKINAWQQHFLNFDECSCCPSWRLCTGKFSHSLKSNPGCKAFFAELFIAAEHVYALRTNKSEKEHCTCR